MGEKPATPARLKPKFARCWQDRENSPQPTRKALVKNWVRVYENAWVPTSDHRLA
jgi:hypothetical protein